MKTESWETSITMGARHAVPLLVLEIIRNAWGRTPSNGGAYPFNAVYFSESQSSLLSGALLNVIFQ